MDAVRKSDGKEVMITKLYRISHEQDVLKHIADAQRSTRKDQHIVQLLDSFKDDREPALVFMVMPLLHRADVPLAPFEFVSELVDLLEQLLEVCSVSSRLSLYPF